MDAGRRRGRLSRVVGAALVVAGLLLLAGAGVYYTYGAYARSKLAALNYAVDTPPTLPAEAAREGFVPLDPSPSPHVLASNAVPHSSASLPADSPETQTTNSVPQAVAQPTRTEDHFQFPVSSYTSLYPGPQVHPKYWDQPMWAGVDVRLPTGPPEGFQLLSDSHLPAPGGAGAHARRIRIPIIGVDSAVSELRILDLGDSRQYETPNNVVGHIPETSNPGGAGNGWFFGHLESRLRGEGEVFHRLPKIPDHLRNGDAVYVRVESEEGEYLYQVTGSRVLRQDDLQLYDSQEATITLVTCVPSIYYDHRLLITAKLVGIRD